MRDMSLQVAGYFCPLRYSALLSCACGVSDQRSETRSVCQLACRRRAASLLAPRPTFQRLLTCRQGGRNRHQVKGVSKDEVRHLSDRQWTDAVHCIASGCAVITVTLLPASDASKAVNDHSQSVTMIKRWKVSGTLRYML